MSIDPWNPPVPPSPRDVGPAAQWRGWWLLREVDPVARGQGFVLATRQLPAAGVTRSAARYGVRTGRLTAAGRGVVGMVSVCDPEEPRDDFVFARRRHALAAAAAARLRPDHVVTGRSAAILHGLPTLAVPPRPELTARTPSGNGRRNSSHVFSASIVDAEVSTWFGVPVATVERTIVDLARHNRRDGIMAADAALWQELIDVQQIEQSLARSRGWPGVRRARAVLALASSLAESPLESITRLAMYDDDFPEPQLQYHVGDRRIDLALPDNRLLIETDGRVKYRTPSDASPSDALRQEKLREHAVRRPGWWMERIIWANVTTSWPMTSDRLWRALQRLGPLPPRTPWRLLWPPDEPNRWPQQA